VALFLGGTVLGWHCSWVALFLGGTVFCDTVSVTLRCVKLHYKYC